MEYFPFTSARYEYDKEYRKNHREQLSAYSREYYERTKTSITCECGATILSLKKKKHCLTKKHQKYVASLVPL